MKHFFNRILFVSFILSTLSLFAQTSGIELLQISDSKPTLTGEAISFQGGPQEMSGTEGTTYAFQHNADSFYVARFAPFAASNDEPMLVYVKCFYPDAVFSQISQTYDGFAPDFAGIGGVNFVAYMKPGYDEFRFWNGTNWSAANTSLRPFYKQTTNLGTRFEVAIPWSAMIPGGGIPDSVKVVCYQTNGNAGSIFSYSQIPKILPAGPQAAPAVSQALNIRVKNIISTTNPLRFNKTKVGSTSGIFLKVYNPGNADLNLGTSTFSAGNPSSEGIAFSIPIQPASTIPGKKTSAMYVQFSPQTVLNQYDANGAILHNATGGTYAFKVTGPSVGEPDIVVRHGNLVVNSTESILFGEEIPENTPVILTLTVKSTGADTLQIGPFISSNPTRFEVLSTSKNSLPPGDSAEVKVRFKGATAGSYSGQLNMSANLGENSYRIPLQATVVAGASGQAVVYQIPNRRIRIDGNANNEWQSSDKISSGTNGLDWFVTWNADSLYLARTGGNNSEPQLVQIQANYPGNVMTSQSFSYDGIATNFTSQGGLNFVAYLKNNYNEYRTTDDTGNWGSASTGLSPRYGTQNSSAHMEVAIAWSTITQGNGIPDSLKMVLFQSNGNAGSPFVYGQAPAGIAGGAISTVIANKAVRKVIARPLNEDNPFDFGDVISGSTRDTTFLVYNKGTSSISAITPFTMSNPEFGSVTDPLSDLEPKKYSAFKVRFSPTSTGNQVSVASGSYSAGPVNQNYSFKILGNGITGPIPDIHIRIGNTVAISGDSLLFGNLDFGNQKDSTIWIRNSGTDTLRINSAILSGTSFSFVNSIPAKLAPGDSVGTRIRFSSSAPAGIKSGKLTLGTNVPGLSTFVINMKGNATVPVIPPSTLLIQQIANNLINTSGAIPASQLQPRFLLSDNEGIKWYATWDTINLYVVKIGGNRAQPQILYMRASYPGAVYTDTPTFYDGFHPNFTGMGGINFSAYLKESSVPYDEFRNWNGTLWLAPNQGLQPLYGNQGADIFAVRIPWDNITQSNGIPDSVRLVLYQTTGSLANFSAYGQSPVGLPSGNSVTPPINLFHSFKIITRLPRESEFDFGNVEIGKSVDTCFLFRNEGPAGSLVTLNGPSSLSGSAYSAVIQTTSGTTIPSQKFGLMKVRFTPSALGNSVGSVTANASFDNPASPYVVHFKGNGVPAAVAGIKVKLGSVLVSSGSTSDIGVAEIGTALDTAFRIINTGLDTLRLSNVGNVSPDWEISPSPTLKIRPGDSTRLVFRKPVTSAGVNFGQFSFSTNVAGSATIQLAVLFQGDSVLSWFPPVPTINDSITITYKQAFGNKALKGVSPVFIHSGVITSGPTGTNWENVQGTFNVPADSVKLLDLGQNRQQIKFRIRDFYNLTGNPTVHRLGMVFRNGDGSKVGKTRTEGDFFIPVNPNPATAKIRVRTSGGASLTNGDTIQFGILPYGSVRDTTVWMKNTGTVPLVFSLINVASFSFTQIGTTPETLAVGDSAKVDIRLDVNGNGPLEGFLNLVSNASNSPTLLIYLTAQGVVSNRDLLSENNLQIYPNPTTGLLNVEMGGELPVSTFQFTDLTGRIALEGKRLKGEQLDISTLASGIWILTLETRSGKLRRKVVKE